jgi:hypothetical protein
MLADYLQAAIPKPVTILGQRLHDFSLGLNMLLLRHESGFLSEGGIKAGDLEFAIFICCHEYDEAREQLERPDLAELLKEWAKKCGAFDYREKCGAFLDYLRDGSAMPELLPIDEEKTGRTPGAPFLQLVKVTVMGELGYTRHEALNAPLGEVLHDYWAYHERKGQAKILGPNEQQHLDMAASEELRKSIEAEGHWKMLDGTGGNDAV